MAEPETPSEPTAPSQEPPPVEEDEFAGLKPRRPRRSPVVALTVIGLGGLLLYHLRDDLSYALSAKTPEELDATRALAASVPAAGRLAAIAGQPDYRDALVFEPKGDRYRRAFFPLLGTGARVVVRADETSTRHELSERFVGRLRRFDDLPYADQIRDYYAGKVKVTHLLDLGRVEKLLAASPGQALAAQAPPAPIDHLGDIRALEPARPVVVVVNFPDDLKVSLSRDKFAVEEDARHEVERLGKPIQGKAVETKAAYVYVVRVGAAERDANIAKLDEKQIPFAMHQERVSTTAGALRAAPDGKALAADGAASSPWPWPQVASIQVDAPIVIPPGALLLTEGEVPGDYTWAPALAAVLVLFLAFNLYLLYRSLAARREPT
jgi:hypothetical protein